MIRAGLQIPNFTYPGVAPEQLFDRVADVAVAGEESGFDTVMVMDHFYQLPLLGPPEHEMFEAYTLLGAIAARTSKAKLGTLVTGVTYRNPAILAKIVTSLDVISRGRAFLGIGAAWFDVEHEALGVDFPPVKERFERLEEALQICRAMFRSERPTFEGTHYRVKDAINSPAPITPGGPPIMIGGSGEKKTLRMMAQYAEMANFTAGFDELPRKLEVLAKHCADVGRDVDTINKTSLGSLILGDTMEDAEAKRGALLQERGLPPWDQLDDSFKAMIGARFVVGDADAVGEQLQSLLALGLDGFTFNLPADGWDVDAVRRAGEVVRKAVS
ncbi:MAG TPA: LLM class F420-dependent oxidoreductase [Acidimicrobiales bacterium]|nr:LLM class F420-dependent oxidoreductase [Acidimicrobiales bacterium]